MAIKDTHELVLTHGKAGAAMAHLTEDLLKPNGIEQLPEKLWSAALIAPTGGKGEKTGRIEHLGKVLGEADQRFFQLHRQRKFVEVAQAEAGMAVMHDLIPSSWLLYRTVFMNEDQLTSLVKNIAKYLETLSPEERQGIRDSIRHSQTKYLPASAYAAYGSTITHPMIHALWNDLLIDTDRGIEVEKDLGKVVAKNLHFVHTPSQTDGHAL